MILISNHVLLCMYIVFQWHYTVHTFFTGGTDARKERFGPVSRSPGPHHYLHAQKYFVFYLHTGITASVTDLIHFYAIWLGMISLCKNHKLSLMALQCYSVIITLKLLWVLQYDMDMITWQIVCMLVQFTKLPAISKDFSHHCSRSTGPTLRLLTCQS